MTNSQIAEIFELMAVFLELKGENPFRVRAYQRAVQVVEGHSRPVTELSREELLEISGIGKGIADHIAEIAKTGKLLELENLRKKFPPGLLDVLRVQGLGPKRAKLLFEKLRVDSLEKLKAAALSGKLKGLPGFGAKLEENVLKGLAFAAKARERMLWWEAKGVLEEILLKLRSCPGLVDRVPAGSFRRGKETVGDLDILCTAADGAAAIEFFTKLPQVERILGAGETKAGVRLRSGVQCDFRVVSPESLGAALQYFTGSKDHNVALRERALKMGYTINEYGLFKVSDKKHSRPVAGKTEEGIYGKLGLDYIPPELRENRGEIEAAEKGRLPRLVELKDVKGDFHNHTRYTDGRNSLEEMAKAAQDMGWEWAALGDHSRSLTVANGLSVEKLRKTIEELKALQPKLKGVRLLRSMEVDILKDGSLDYPDEVLGEIDVVVGSVHGSFSMSREEMTQRIGKAVRSPHLDIVGHLSGRLLGRREAYEVDEERLFQQALNSGTAFEINGQPQRQDLWDVHVRRAKDLGVPLAVTTDAHSADQFRYMEQAVLIARRGWAEKKDLLNCLSYKELKDWLS